MAINERLMTAATAIADAQKLAGAIVSGDDGYAYMPGTSVKVLDYARKFYAGRTASWVQDYVYADVEQVEIAPNDFYLAHWPGTRKVAVIFPSNPTQNMWRQQEFEADVAIEHFMRRNGAWT